jgi:AraC family transcriptional regulator of adaptative response/methylated-DNA-[protein]-cysteine methyltransferase
MLAAASDDALYLLEFVDRRALERQLTTLARRTAAAYVPGENAILAATQRELDEYFAGERRAFSLPFAAPGTTFQERVWRELAAIPCGETRSYADIAAALGCPGSVRAVAQANGANRLALVIPCHRVIGADGSLTGYGGQLWRKRALLDLESGPNGLPVARARSA